ncbi:SGNH/GDSL hydrolase family protein [Cellulomonas hominis]
MRTVPLRGGPAQVRGAVTVDETPTGLLPRRLGAVARSQLPDELMWQTAAECAGIRLAFRTAATVVELDVRATRLEFGPSAPVPASVYDLTVDGVPAAERELVATGRFVPSVGSTGAHVVPGPVRTVRFDGLPPGDKELEIWLPITDQVELSALRADAPVTEPEAPRGPRWLHHGSSISHGHKADRPTGAWPVVAARLAGAELTNLSFAGNAMLDQLTARTIRDQPADIVSLKVGINLVNRDLMRLRAFRTAVHGFLDTIRDGHPSIPLLVVSPIYCEPVEECAGPTMQAPDVATDWCVTAGIRADVAQGKLSLQVIRTELAAIVSLRQASDPFLHYLSGLDLYDGADAARMPLPDNLHPGPDVHQLMGERFARLVLGGLVGQASTGAGSAAP